MFNATCQIIKRALKRLRRVLPLQSRAHLAALANPSSFVPVPTAIAGPAAVAHALHVPRDVEGLAGRVAHPAGVPRVPQVPDRAPTTRRCHCRKRGASRRQTPLLTDASARSPHLPRSGQEANHPPLKIPEHKEQFPAETRAPTRPVTKTGPVGKDSNRAG